MTPALAAHYASGSTTLAAALRIERKDGQVFAFTGADHDAEIDGITYLAGPGLDLSGLVSTSGFDVDNLELSVLPDDVLLTRDSFVAGLWQGARFWLFEYNWADVSMGIHPLKRGWLGEPKLQDVSITVELRSLRQALQQNVGAYTSQSCRNRLGDNRCGVDLIPLTHDSAITVVVDRYGFEVDTEQVDGYFTAGIARFLDGLNAGVSRKVRVHADGRITLATPAPFELDVGVQVELIAGCQKRLQDCRDVHDNVLRFGGEPHLPGIDALTAYPETRA